MLQITVYTVNYTNYTSYIVYFCFLFLNYTLFTIIMAERTQPAASRGAEPYRSHPLFPVLEYLSTSVKQNQQTLQKMETSINTLQTKIVSISSVQEELLTLMNEQKKKQFSLKAEGFDVCRI